MPSVRVDRRLYVDSAGNLVESGDPAAAFLWASEGSQVDVDEAERMGYKARRKPSDKAKAAPSNKAVEPDDDAHVCECGFVAKSAGGLGAHMRTHEND